MPRRMSETVSFIEILLSPFNREDSLPFHA